MNDVNLVGRLTKDPAMGMAGETTTCTFTLAIDRPVGAGKEKKTDFPRIVVFGNQAENCGKFLVKGRLAGVTGSIQTGDYKDKEGKTVYTTDVVANRVEFYEWGEKPSADGTTEGGAPASAPEKGSKSESKPAPAAPPINELEDDDDIPF